MRIALPFMLSLCTACSVAVNPAPEDRSSNAISPALSDVSTDPKYNANSDGYGGFTTSVDGEAQGSAPELLAARAFCENGFGFTLEVKLYDPEGLDGVYWVGADFGDPRQQEVVDQLWLEPTDEPGLWRAYYKEWDTALDCAGDYDVLFEIRDQDGWTLYEIVPFGASSW